MSEYFYGTRWNNKSNCSDPCDLSTCKDDIADAEDKIAFVDCDFNELPPELKKAEKVKEMSILMRIDNLDNLPPNVEKLLLSRRSKKIPKIPKSVKNLRIFLAKHIKKLENLEDATGLEEIYMNDCKIKTVENLPPNLKKLTLKNCKVSEIKEVPQSLETLKLRWNKMKDGDMSVFKGSSLKYLDLHANRIESVTNLPNTVKKLKMKFNRCPHVDPTNKSLIHLDLSNNKIKDDELVIPNVKSLYLRDNHMTKVPDLPTSIKNLDISDQKIKRVENLPPNLEVLDMRFPSLEKPFGEDDCAYIERDAPPLQVLIQSHHQYYTRRAEERGCHYPNIDDIPIVLNPPPYLHLFTQPTEDEIWKKIHGYINKRMAEDWD